MSSEQQGAEQKRERATPAEKTDQPRRVRATGVHLLFTEEPTRVAALTSIAEAVKAIKEHQNGCAVVCDENGIPVGLLTEHDLLTKVVAAEINMTATVQNVMSTHVATLSKEATVGDAVQMMSERGSRYLIVVNEDGRLANLVSVDDVINYLAESYAKEVANLPPVPAQVMDTAEGG